MVATETTAEAEELRLQGNAAFASKKWNLAVKKYRASVDIDGASKDSAKVYSNLAAALCKLTKYDEAHEAAKLGVKVDPDWPKGHWRLGSVLELQKDFLYALGSYEKAVTLAPNEEVYSKAFKRMMSRMGCEDGRDADGTLSVSLPATSVHKSDTDLPCYVVWERIKEKSNDLSDMSRVFPQYITGSIKSEQWLGQGLYYWHGALMRMLGEMAGFPSSQTADDICEKLFSLKEQMQAGSISRVEFDTMRYKLTGQPPSQGTEFGDFMNGLTYLHGEQIALEMGGGKFCPSPSWLKWYRPQQVVAVQMTLFYERISVRHTLAATVFSKSGRTDWSGGEELHLSQALCDAVRMYLANAGQDKDDVPDEGVSPEAAVSYIKEKLKEGKSWEHGVRKYVSFLYRGTVLAAWLARLTEGLGVALRHFKWARKFITLADKEWGVSSNESYATHGASFRKSFQVNILVMELVTAFSLRNYGTPKLEEALYEFNLAQEIITIATQQQAPTGYSFDAWMFYTVFSRKPLAYVCSYLASNMSRMKDNPELLGQVMVDTGMMVILETGMMEPRQDNDFMALIADTATVDEMGINSLIAETYKCAALAQLPDDKETTILWWGYASHLAHAGGYKMADLRRGINNAANAAQQMDPLWGPSMWKGSIYQKEAMLLARYYQDKGDDFVLPRLEMERRPDGSLAVFVDGQVICHNFDRHMRMEKKKLEDKDREAYFDTTEAEDEMGNL